MTAKRLPTALRDDLRRGFECRPASNGGWVVLPTSVSPSELRPCLMAVGSSDELIDQLHAVLADAAEKEG